MKDQRYRCSIADSCSHKGCCMQIMYDLPETDFIHKWQKCPITKRKYRVVKTDVDGEWRKVHAKGWQFFKK
jgi:hypothetical protein